MVRLPGPNVATSRSAALSRDVQQRSLAGRQVVRDRRFEQVAEVVQLVAVVALEYPALRPGPAMRILRIDRARRVDVAVRLLRGGDLRDQAVDVGVELRIGTDAERVRRAFDHLVEVGFVERITGRPLVDVRSPRSTLAARSNIFDAARQLALLECGRNAHGAVGLDARRPEHVVEMDRGERHRLDRIVRLLSRARSATAPSPGSERHPDTRPPAPASRHGGTIPPQGRSPARDLIHP